MLVPEYETNKPLSATQVIYISKTGDMTIEPGTCRICGGPLLGGGRPYSDYKWDNWNSENMAHALYSDKVCGACAYIRSAMSAKGDLKLNKGFIASLAGGFIQFMEKQDAIEALEHLPMPPFVMAIAYTYVRTNYAFMLPVSYSARHARIGLIMGRKRETRIKSGTPGKYAKISPVSEEIYTVDIDPSELLDTVNSIKDLGNPIYTAEMRRLIMADPYWELAFWLADSNTKSAYLGKETKPND